MKGNLDWWRGAVIYQIYPRSFLDSNNDGIGDFLGIISKLEYIAALGVDAIWLSPFLQSPQADFGYDVSDYYQVDPLFGELKDFDFLIKRAHELNLKVMMDLVLSHTSTDHPWFQQSKQNKTNDKANWYVWADPKPDGSAPNNWLSVFGGSAWEFEPMRGQYYLHNFLTSQADLNFHNPEVLAEMLAVMRFWLDRGVDGFRLDAINFCVHDALLRDNPLRSENEPGAEGAPASNPYARQYHLFDKTQPENLQVLKSIRQLLNEYPGAVAMGEVGDDQSIITGAAYTRGNDFLHTVYTFHLLDVSDQFSAALMRQTIQEVEAHMIESWPCWALNNHDVARVATRLSRGKPSAALCKIVMMMLLSLRGTICLYQGEELGLTEAEVPFEKMRDPYGIRFYPEFKGRDGCRTPMPWDSEVGGFSQAEPWLPMYLAHLQQAVNLQEQDVASVLHAYRQFLHWRKQHPALIKGEIELLDSAEDLLAFKRISSEETILVVLNLSDQAQKFILPTGNFKALTGYNEDFAVPVREGEILLMPYQVFFGELD